MPLMKIVIFTFSLFYCNKRNANAISKKHAMAEP